MLHTPCAKSSKTIFEQLYETRWERIESGMPPAARADGSQEYIRQYAPDELELSLDVSWLDDDEWEPETVLTILARVGQSSGSAYHHQGAPMMLESHVASSGGRSAWM
jgi:hypothetical protein